MSRLTASGGGPAATRTPAPPERRGGAPEGATPLGARVEAVFTLYGDAERIAECAAGLIDRLQRVALDCEAGCDLDVSLAVQPPGASEAHARCAHES